VAPSVADVTIRYADFVPCIRKPGPKATTHGAER
jgi:hypothetical protein